MDSLLTALGHPVRIAIVEFLLGLGPSRPTASGGATHAEIRTQLKLQGGTLSKGLDKLREVDLIAEALGPRLDQPLYHLRRPDQVLSLLRVAAELDAALSEELAILQRADAEIKAERARRLQRASAAAAHHGGGK